MSQTRKYETQHGTAFAMRTHKDDLYLTDLVVGVEVIETGRVVRLDRSTSKWLAQPACGCEDMSFDTLGDATCCLANHAMNKQTHALMENERTGKYTPVQIDDTITCDLCASPFVPADRGSHLPDDLSVCPTCADTDDTPADVLAMVPAHTDQCQHEGCTGTAVYYGSCLTHTHNPGDYSFSQLARNAKRALAGAATIACLLLPGHADARDLPLVPTDGECVITRTFEDGSATALCGHDTWAFDADGGFIQDHGIVFFYRDPGTWYEAN